ncbi:uncharacterized protein ATC70_006381 [Mucor velutinosus]|uniref:Uncharacterized protein n=1 Tax=Mucor velutinosus TaxID=708070 RepID=A0AAN7D5I4_9FUNG|nr:hypothetical protein ATC70_006381 [Mucor velutinosus]
MAFLTSSLDYLNVIKIDEILGSMTETVDPVIVYGNKVEAEVVAQEYQATSQGYTQIADLKKNDKNCIKLSDSPESEVTDNVQDKITEELKLVDGDQEEKTVSMMNDKLKEERSGVYVMQEREVNSMAKKEQDQRNVVCSKQELKVNVHGRETPCIRIEQNNSQLTTYKEPIEIVVKLSDIIHTSYQPNLKLSDLAEQSSAPVKHQAPPPSHLPRSRVTLADLM